MSRCPRAAYLWEAKRDDEGFGSFPPDNEPQVFSQRLQSSAFYLDLQGHPRSTATFS